MDAPDLLGFNRANPLPFLICTAVGNGSPPRLMVGVSGRLTPPAVMSAYFATSRGQSHLIVSYDTCSINTKQKRGGSLVKRTQQWTVALTKRK